MVVLETRQMSVMPGPRRLVDVFADGVHASREIGPEHHQRSAPRIRLAFAGKLQQFHAGAPRHIPGFCFHSRSRGSATGIVGDWRRAGQLLANPPRGAGERRSRYAPGGGVGHEVNGANAGSLPRVGVRIRRERGEILADVAPPTVATEHHEAKRAAFRIGNGPPCWSTETSSDRVRSRRSACRALSPALRDRTTDGNAAHADPAPQPVRGRYCPPADTASQDRWSDPPGRERRLCPRWGVVARSRPGPGRPRKPASMPSKRCAENPCSLLRSSLMVTMRARIFQTSAWRALRREN